MTEQIIDILIRIGVLLLIYGGILLGGKLKELIAKELSAEEKAFLDKVIQEFVTAAEQMFKNEDEDGTIRLNYVQQMLIEAGYELTDEIRAMIESKVYEVNLKSKGVSAA